MTEQTEDSQKLEGKLIQSIKIEGLGDLTQEYAEIGLDMALEDGILKDIPIVGTLVKAIKAVGSVRDRLYLKKLLSFLQKIGETTQEQRNKFIEDNCHNKNRFEEAVLLILEQADNMNKSVLVGKIFKACILGKITYGNAIRLSEMVNRAFWSDIELMLKDEEGEHWQRLFMAGFSDIKSLPLRFNSNPEFDYISNRYSKMLIEINNE